MTHKEKFKLYKELREQGKSYYEVAEIIGAPISTVKSYCRKHGLGYSKQEIYNACQTNKSKFEPKDEKYWKEKIKKRFGDSFDLFKIGSTDSSGERTIECKCLKCGTVKVVHSATLRKNHGQGICVNCLETEKRIRDALKKAEELSEALKQERIDIKKRIKEKQVGFNYCKCGTILPANLSTCESCRAESKRLSQRKHDKKKEIRRRSDSKGGDWTIQLDKLYERDGGVCQICGEACDWDDYIVTSKAFIAGNRYPSIDHIISLAKGGKHIWSNVQLAHRICNSLKSDH